MIMYEAYLKEALSTTTPYAVLLANLLYKPQERGQQFIISILPGHYRLSLSKTSFEVADVDTLVSSKERCYCRQSMVTGGSQTEDDARLQLRQTCTQDKPYLPCPNVQYPC